MERLPVYIVVGATVVAIPLIVVLHTLVMDRTVPLSILVGVGYAATCLVVALRVGVGAAFVVVGVGTAPEAVLQSRALEVLVIRVDLLTLTAADWVREGAAVRAVGAIASGGLVIELGHVGNTYVVLQTQLRGVVQRDIGVGRGVRGLVVGVGDKGRAREVGVKVLHGAAVTEAIFDLPMTGSPELFFALQICFVEMDGLLLGDKLAVEVNIGSYSLVLEFCKCDVNAHLLFFIPN